LWSLSLRFHEHVNHIHSFCIIDTKTMHKYLNCPFFWHIWCPNFSSISSFSKPNF
jgi:hypothetical protein